MRDTRPGTHQGLQDVPDAEVRAIAEDVARHAVGLRSADEIALLTLAVAYGKGWRPGRG